MASSPAILVLAFFIAFSISSVDVALATRKLLAPPTFPSLPNFPYVPLPPLSLGTPLYPEYRLPPPITTIPIVPNFPTVPIFSPPVTTTAP